MAESKSGLRKPVFTKVDQLRPGTSGHTLTVKVVSTKMVLQKGRADGSQVRQMRIAECLVGDETGLIIFTARNDQGKYISRVPITVLEYYISLYFYSHVGMRIMHQVLFLPILFCKNYYHFFFHLHIIYWSFSLRFFNLFPHFRANAFSDTILYLSIMFNLILGRG